jgi:hypothetical protein
MDFITGLLDLLLHIDKTMLQFIEMHGVWIYALLVAIIFAETGLVFMPFLPGDSLLFVAGAVCAALDGNFVDGGDRWRRGELFDRSLVWRGAYFAYEAG